jgi:hypothetical protein
MLVAELPIAEMTPDQLSELAVPEFDPSYRLPAETYAFTHWVDSQANTVPSKES